MLKLRTILIAFLLLNSTFMLKSQDAKNVLFIAVDDLKPILGCYGNTEILTPNIDKLASSGTVFLNNHCQQAVCAPSRASLLTGLRPDNTKVWDLKTIMRDHVPDVLTMPQYFRQMGYETVAFGKIYDPRSVDKELDEPSWSIPYNEVNMVNYHPKFGTPFGGRWQLPQTKTKAQKYIREAEIKGMKGYEKTRYAQQFVKPSTEMIDIPDEAYMDGQITINSIKMMKRLTNQDKPFFLAVGYKKPHLPFTAPKKYWDLYNRDEIKLSKWQKQPFDGPDIAMHTWGELKSYSDIGEHIGPDGLLSDQKQAELIHGYLACVSFIDVQIGKLIDELERLGLDKNTTIVLWGDHGWHLGDHGLWCKHSNFEQATRSPLIFSDPDINGNIKNSSPTEFVDIFPTLCDLVGINIPDVLDGKSLKSIMDGRGEKVKDYAISQYPRGNNRMGYSLRTERYRYTAWFAIDFRKGEKASTEKFIGEELYDYQKDDLETKNFADEKSYLKVKNDLVDKLNNFLKI